jgi:TRAP-type uncharacterized transport system fused permease subunit
MGLALFGRFRGGPAKAAILGCCLFGMITGSQVAAVAAVGVFTIPLMIRSGYQPMTAASITALAGMAGCSFPGHGRCGLYYSRHVRGSYWDVAVPNSFGAFLYVTVYMLVELRRQTGLKGLPKSVLPQIGKCSWNAAT